MNRVLRIRSTLKKGSPIDLGDDWALVMNPGWYDYTYASDRFSQER